MDNKNQTFPLLFVEKHNISIAKIKPNTVKTVEMLSYGSQV